MFHITIITVGELKKGPIHDLVQDLAKRLKPYAKLGFKAVKEESFRSSADRDRVYKEEGGRIRKAMTKDAFTVLLTEHGVEYKSEDFAAQLEAWSEHGARHLEFIIAGPLGMDPYLKEEVDATLSLSKMTMPHELAQLILLEQLYRAGTILNGKTYHY